MFGNGRLAVRGTLAAGLAGLALLAGGPALAQTGAPGAPAVAAPAGAGSFKTWAAARKAAGFTLYVPARTAGLVRRNQILVTRCTASSRVRYDVYALWGGSTYLALDQNATGGACSNPGPARSITTYRKSGRTYHLSGFCGGKGQPSCSSKTATLLLTWKIGAHYFVAYSAGLLRGRLLSFATSVHPS
jgi:hypothetical protein